ncbi:UNVERIFIED_CONTAM: hypothetical protein NCL1_40077 [Trichonephila clavipes]
MHKFTSKVNFFNGGQVRIIAATSPHLYNEGSDEELTSSRSPPKVHLLDATICQSLPTTSDLLLTCFHFPSSLLMSFCCFTYFSVYSRITVFGHFLSNSFFFSTVDHHPDTSSLKLQENYYLPVNLKF